MISNTLIVMTWRFNFWSVNFFFLWFMFLKHKAREVICFNFRHIYFFYNECESFPGFLNPQRDLTLGVDLNHIFPVFGCYLKFRLRRSRYPRSVFLSPSFLSLSAFLCCLPTLHTFTHKLIL